MKERFANYFWNIKILPKKITFLRNGKEKMWLRIKPKSISCGSFNKSFKSDWPRAELYSREVPIKFPWQRRMNTCKGCKFERFGRFTQRQKTEFSTLKIGCFRYFVESTINSCHFMEFVICQLHYTRSHSLLVQFVF